MATLQDQINALGNKMKVKVTKDPARMDDRCSLCGEPVQQDDEGNQFFIIPAHTADYQSKLHPHYNFGEPFIEGLKEEKTQETVKTVAVLLPIIAAATIEELLRLEESETRTTVLAAIAKRKAQLEG